MITNKDLAIQEIEKLFENLSNRILEQLHFLDELFENSETLMNDETFEKLLKNERKIDNCEVDIDNSIIRTIVLYQPMASDLRRLFSIYHMTINLERVGDLVVKIAGTVREIKDSHMVDESAEALHSMLKISSKMVNSALLSFINNDTEPASWTIMKDSTLDEMNQKLLRRTIKSAGLPKSVQATIDSLFDVRSIIASIERIGDHATNIAEASIYAISGSNIRHKDKNKK